MKKKILFMDPVYNDDFRDDISEYLDNIKRSDTDIEVISLGKKPGPEHLEYRCYEIMAMPDIVRMVKEAEESGYDAAIIGCFYDPALRACREVAEKMVVSAPAESSLHIASTIGESISIIVGRQKWMPEIKETIHKYGFFNKVVSIKPFGVGVLDFQKDHEQTLRRMRRAAIEAVEKGGADVIVLGCTAELGFFKELQNELGIPVIDVSLAAFKCAEFLVDLKQNMDWTHSKRVGYQSPPSEEMAAFRLFTN